MVDGADLATACVAVDQLVHTSEAVVAYVLDLAAMVREASRGRTPLAIEGNGTRRGLGRPMQTATTLSTTKLRGVTLYEPTELVLSRSGYTGAPVRLVTNRAFLGRALRLGFSEVEIPDEKSPVVCRREDLVYCWQPLSPESAIEPTDDVTRIDSGPAGAPACDRRDASPRERTIVSERTASIRS